MRIPDRSVLRVVGAKAPNFLSALCTTNVHRIGGNGDFAFLLNAKGRVMFDIRIWKDSLGLLIDVHYSMIEALERHLKGFDLRKEFQFKRMKDLAIETNENAPFSYRISFNSTAPSFSEWWDWERVVRRGLAQVPTDLQPGVSFPFDAGADLIGAVSWDKGCYLGQELVARASRLGSVRRRLFPFEGTQAEVGQVLFDSEGVEVGKILSVYRRVVNEGRSESLISNNLHSFQDQNKRANQDSLNSNSLENITSEKASFSDDSSEHASFFGFALLNVTIPHSNFKSLKIHNPLNASALLKNIDNQ
jgi:folate-binding protein YgfZ